MDLRRDPVSLEICWSEFACMYGGAGHRRGPPGEEQRRSRASSAREYAAHPQHTFHAFTSLSLTHHERPRSHNQLAGGVDVMACEVIQAPLQTHEEIPCSSLSFTTSFCLLPWQTHISHSASFTWPQRFNRTCGHEVATNACVQSLATNVSSCVQHLETPIGSCPDMSRWHRYMRACLLDKCRMKCHTWIHNSELRELSKVAC